MDEHMDMRNWWNGTDRGKHQIVGEKPIPVSFPTTQIPNRLV